MNEREFEATIESYEKWLLLEATKDRRNKTLGLPPLPRSEEEREAIKRGKRAGK